MKPLSAFWVPSRLENHEFHLHQLHFLVDAQRNFEINGTEPAPGITGQFLDTIEVLHWDGNPSHPYPRVTLRIDFRGPDIGDFVFHCHILNHEDLGMMNIIRVQRKSMASNASDLVESVSWNRDWAPYNRNISRTLPSRIAVTNQSHSFNHHQPGRHIGFHDSPPATRTAPSCLSSE